MIRARVLTIAAAAVLAACAGEQNADPVYESAAVERASISVSVGSAGVIEPLATVEVKSKASGEVLELRVETGDHVAAGELLVRIDPRTVRNRLAQAEAELKAALSRRTISQSQMKRAESLVRQGTFTEADYEQAALELANAEAQVVTAEVAVENARIAVDDTEIRAPVDGTVIDKPVEKGQVISSPTQDVGGGTLLMLMADLSAVQVRALVDETDIGKIRPGMQAEVTVAAYPNQPFAGEVVKIEPQAVIEQNVTMFAVIISIRNPDGLLLPGMNAEVDVSVAEAEDVLTIPVMALRTERDIGPTASILGMDPFELRAQIGSGDPAPPSESTDEAPPEIATDYRFGGDFWVVLQPAAGRLRAVPLRSGITDLDRVEILSGLGAGDRVLILPSANLIETQERLQDWLNRRIGTLPGMGGQ